MSEVYAIEGMTCNGCVAKVQQQFDEDKRFVSAKVSLEPSQVLVQYEGEPLDVSEVKRIVAKAGPYNVVDNPAIENPSLENPSIEKPLPGDPPKTADVNSAHAVSAREPAQQRGFIETYKPLLLIVGFIALTSTMVQIDPTQPMAGLATLEPMLWMRHFMAGFFLAFSFFKLLNISGFASSYRMYDWIARKFPAWGFIYPFVELALGLLYLTNAAPIFTNWATVIVLGVSSLGVIESNLNKKKIQCACLGDVFDLPMSVVTIVEDVTMVAMAGGMLLLI
ncbi:MAG: heavy-metal-associated domain-containing protein [Balneolaceae bacterium]|nr:heavy-metal-associated domain-containing protein [Balneolaceae bacterium]